MLGGAPAERWRSEPPASSRWPSSSSMWVGAGPAVVAAVGRRADGRCRADGRFRAGGRRRADGRAGVGKGDCRSQCASVGEHRDDVLRRGHRDLGDDRTGRRAREGEHDARLVHCEGQHAEAPRIDRQQGGERLRSRTELGRFDPADAIRRRHVRPPRAWCFLVRPCRGRPGAAAPCPAPTRPDGCRPSSPG